MPFEYVRSINRYRDKATGRFKSRQDVLLHVQELIESGNDTGAILAQQVADGSISPDDFGELLRQDLKITYVQNLMLGRGGRDQTTAADYGGLGYPLRVQYAFIDNYVEQMKQAQAEGREWSVEYMQNRNRLYYQTARQAYERGHSAAYGTPVLPAYPGDLSTACMSGCLCWWNIERVDGGFDCYWEITAGVENCPDCVERNTLWYPLRVRDGVVDQSQLDAARHLTHHRHGGDCDCTSCGGDSILTPDPAYIGVFARSLKEFGAVLLDDADAVHTAQYLALWGFAELKTPADDLAWFSFLPDGAL